MKNKIEPEIVQHPSTPDEIKNPEFLVDQCLAEFFRDVLHTIAEYGFEVDKREFHSDFRLIIEITTALLLKQEGIHHELQVVLGENNILNTVEEE